ncbi:MAG: hypothetical protein MJ237_03935 [bacterium]|nr:hypothetical protein [bacterium]
MKLTTFFNTLNNKIREYDKIAVNPFLKQQNMIIIWIENPEHQECDNNKCI